MAKTSDSTVTNAMRAINAIALTIAIYRCVKAPALTASPMSINFWLSNPVIDVVVLSMSGIGLLNKRHYYQLMNDEHSRQEPVDQRHLAIAYNVLNLGRCTAGFFTLAKASPELATSSALSTLNIVYQGLH